MTGAAWFALAGLVAMILAGVLMVLAERAVIRAQAERALLRRQLEMIREACALSRYGAQDEAVDMIDRAVALKPEWEVG